MDYKYDVINYNKNIPATIMHLNLNSDTQKAELQWHRETEIVYVINGRCECSHNGEVKIIEENDFILFNSEDVPLVRPVNGTSCELLCIQLSFEYMRMFCKPIDSVFFDVTEKPDVKARIIDELKKIADVVSSDDDYSDLLQVANVNNLYYILLKNCVYFRRASASVVLPKRDFSYAKTAIAYINENFKHEIPLDEISAVVKNRLTIFIDGGIRHGEDVLKALALGADAVLIGRPAAIANIGGYAEGVTLLLDTLKQELQDAMTITGIPDLQHISSNILQKIK